VVSTIQKETAHQTWGGYNINVIDYDYIESNRDYICLETSSERKPNPSAWFDVIIFSYNIRYE